MNERQLERLRQSFIPVVDGIIRQMELTMMDATPVHRREVYGEKWAKLMEWRARL